MSALGYHASSPVTALHCRCVSPSIQKAGLSAEAVLLYDGVTMEEPGLSRIVSANLG